MKLAEQCHTSQNYIAEIEGGKKFPSVAMIERIAGALKVESYLLFQNSPSVGGNSLSAVEKRELIDKIHSAVAKIVGQY